MQAALGIKTNGKRTFSLYNYRVVSPVKKSSLTEFENALLVARNKLKETEDKIEERSHKIELFGTGSRERIG